MDVTFAKQGSEEWLQARAGRITMSSVGLLLTKPKGTKAWADGANTLARKLAVERVRQTYLITPVTPAMQWGHDTEDEARAAYEFRTGCSTKETGFIAKTEYAGGSPDGWTFHPDDGQGVHEIKCPFCEVNQVKVIEEGPPREHYAQCQGNLWVTGAAWCDYISYDPRMPEKSRLYLLRIERNEEYIAKIATAVDAFNQFIEEKVARLK